MDEHTYVLVTGANSGLGFSICCRLIDDFLKTRPTSLQLTIIFTTRSLRKGSDTLKLLQKRLSMANDRVHLRPEIADLTNLLSVKALAKRLVASDLPRINAVILNAGTIGAIAIDWATAVWTVTTDTVNALTWPRFKLSTIGSVSNPQFPVLQGKTIEEPPLGEIFCANVFGHYMLVHWLMPLLRACDPQAPGKIEWISSIEGSSRHFNSDDLQGTRSPTPYEHSKRLTDLIALTSRNQPSTAQSVRDFTTLVTDSSSRPATSIDSTPAIYVVHPGVCVTPIVPLPWILLQSFTLMAYLSRFLGSPWALISSYAGAVSMVWLTFASNEQIKAKEAEDGNDHGGAVKLGSAITRSGKERIAKTDVSGWGLDGSGKPFKETWWATDRFGAWGRAHGSTDATKEDVDGFIEDGARAWKEMEALRKEWESRIEEYEKMQQ